jgi:hypothetical protein
MVVDNIKNHKGTNPRHFRNCSCGWRGILEQSSCLLVEVPRVYIWPIEYQISWGTGWKFSKIFNYANNICSCEFFKQNSYYNHKRIGIDKKNCVATLALGSWPRQGFARLWAKREAREWRKVWGNEPSHSQGSFHFGSWSFGGLPNF